MKGSCSFIKGCVHAIAASPPINLDLATVHLRAWFSSCYQNKVNTEAQIVVHLTRFRWWSLPVVPLTRQPKVLEDIQMAEDCIPSFGVLEAPSVSSIPASFLSDAALPSDSWTINSSSTSRDHTRSSTERAHDSNPRHQAHYTLRHWSCTSNNILCRFPASSLDLR